jgi:outer membrane protein TolC
VYRILLSYSALLYLAFMVSLSAFAEPGDFMLNVIPEPPVITFKGAALRALERSAPLKKVLEGVHIADSDSMLATSKIMPKISLRASQEAAHKIPSAGADESTRASLQLAVPLLDAKSLVEIKAKRELLASAKDKYEYEQNNLVHEVGLLYIEALIAQALRDNALEEHQLYQRQMSNLERQTKVHNVRQLTVHKVQYQAHKAYSDYVQKGIDFQKSLGELGRKIAMRELFVLASFEVNSPHLTKEHQDLVVMADSAPDYRIARKELAASEYSLLGERLDFLPKITTTLDGGLLWPYQQGVVGNTDLSVRMMLNLELPLFSGGATLAAIKNKTAQKTISELSLNGKPGEKILLVNGLKRQLIDLEAIKKSAELALTAATKAKDSAIRLFEAGEIADSGRDLIDAIANHASAKNQLIVATLKYEASKIKLMFVIGKAKELLDV